MSETPSDSTRPPEGIQPPESTPPPAATPPPPPPPPAYAQTPTPAVLTGSEERTWAGAAHWSSYVAGLIGLSFLGPLLVMLIQGDKSPFVRQHAVESLNFQLSLLIYAIVSAVLILVVVGIFLLIAVGLLWLLMPIFATLKASAGEPYRYPLTIRMVS
jgi:uncharacterized protein